MDLTVRVIIVGSALIILSLAIISGLGEVRGNLSDLSTEQQIRRQVLQCKQLCLSDMRSNSYGYLRNSFNWRGENYRCLDFIARFWPSYTCQAHEGARNARSRYWEE